MVRVLPRRFLLLLSLGCTGFVVSGCTHAATIQTRSRFSERATIIENDGEALVVQDADTGEVRRIPHTDVVDIQHPGTMEIVLGGTLAAGGVALAIGASWPKKSDCPATTTAGASGGGCTAGQSAWDGMTSGLAVGALLALTVPGLGMMVWGNAARTDSVHRAEPKAKVAVVPLPAERGAALAVQF